MAERFSSFNRLLSSLERQQTPALIWYSAPGERIELSGRVLMNWVYKTANMLEEELDFSDAPQVSVLMGPHWRSAAILLAALLAGGAVDFEDNSTDSSIVFTDTLGHVEKFLSTDNYEHVVAVDRGALAVRFMGSLDAQAIDYCALVRSFGDVYQPLLPISGEEHAIADLSHRQALDTVKQCLEEIEQKNAQAFILPLSQHWNWHLLSILIAIIASGKTAVVLDPLENWNDERLKRIMSDERAILHS